MAKRNKPTVKTKYEEKDLVPGIIYTFSTFAEGFVVGMFLKMDKGYYEILVLTSDQSPGYAGKIMLFDVEKIFDFPYV
jgi:hypothetical protein